MQITASSEGGPLTIRASADADSGAEGAAGLPAQFGIQDAIDFSGYDGAAVQLSALASEAAAPGGAPELNAMGAPAPGALMLSGSMGANSSRSPRAQPY